MQDVFRLRMLGLKPYAGEVCHMKARDIMTPKPFVVIPTDDVCKAAELMRYENIGGVPVVSDPARPALVGLITDRDTGQAKGFGFVEMSNGAEADRAIAELNGRELDGRALNINEARPKEARPSGGGGGGYGGQRRGNRY